MRTFIAAVVAALSLLGVAASAQQPQSADAARAAQLIAAGPHELTGFEVYHLLNGRTLAGKTYAPPHNPFSWTFSVGGQVTSSGGFQGTWQIVGNEAVMNFPATGRTINLPLRTDGAGRYFHAKTGVEMRLQ